MKKQIIFLISVISIFTTVGTIGSVSAIGLPHSMASVVTPGCDWEPIPGSDEITNSCGLGDPFGGLPINLMVQPYPHMNNLMWSNSQQLNPMNNWVLLNPQPLPPVDCPMCGAIVLDKSLFETASEVKITTQNDGSIVISAVMSNNTNDFHSSNMTNQQ
jgi:hypothetical protein